jgi:hypothetical protein
MQTILIISFSDLKNDPRIQRQIAFLKEQYRIIAVGLTDPEVPDVRYIPCTLGNRTLPIQAIKGLLLVLKHYDLFYWFPGGVTQVIRQLYDIHADLILANDIQTVPLALKLATMHGAKVIFDAHEYFPKQFEHRLWWRKIVGPYLTKLCLTNIPQVDGMITVGQAIAEQYEQDTGVKPVVMTNAPFYQDIQPCLRSHDEQRIRLIHHGYAQRSRKIENMIAVMGYLDERFELDFLLVPSPSSPGYIEELQQLAKNNPRIQFLPPVSMQELVGFSNQYDIGVFLVEPTTFNLRYTLPNKFFEFIQARLAVAIGPSVEMARLVQQYQCGVVADNFSPRSLAKALMRLDHTIINAYKRQSHKAAQQLSAEQNRGILLDMVGRLLP